MLLPRIPRTTLSSQPVHGADAGVGDGDCYANDLQQRSTYAKPVAWTVNSLDLPWSPVTRLGIPLQWS